MAFEPDRRFSSLTEAANFLLERQIRDPWERRWVPRDSGVLTLADLPKHLYRGEPGCYESTICSEQRPQCYRLKRGPALNADDRKRLNHLKGALLWQLRQKQDYCLSPDEALGYLQHYGLPTNIVDFTGDLPVALAFAACGDGALARIAEMVWPHSVRVTPIHQYWNHPWAERAQRQKAVGIPMTNGLTDLKSNSARSHFRLKWYEFPVSDTERAHFRGKKDELLSHHDDPSAGFLRFHITEYAEAKGKLSPALTEWLLEENRIPIAPRCFVVKAFELPDVVVNFCDTDRLPKFRSDIEASYSLRYWSSDHPDRSFDRMERWEWPEVGAITADPRTYHPDV